MINRRDLPTNKSFIPEILENLKSNKALKMAISRRHIPIHDIKMFSHIQTNAVDAIEHDFIFVSFLFILGKGLVIYKISQSKE